MEFLIAAEANCKPAIVQKAEELNPALFEAGDPLFEITYSGATPECLSSIVGHIASRVMSNSNTSFVTNFLDLAWVVADTNGPDVKEALRAMALRIELNQYNVKQFYKMLRLNRIDLTDSFPPVPAEQWSVTEAAGSHEAFQRAIYLLQMNVPEAEERFAEGLARVATKVDPLQRHVRHILEELDHQSAERLLRPYMDDPRRARGLFGPDQAVGLNIRDGLALQLMIRE